MASQLVRRRAGTLVVLLAALLLPEPSWAAVKPAASSEARIEAFRRGLERCWAEAPAMLRRHAPVPVVLDLRLGPDGTLLEAEAVDEGHLADPAYRALAESAVRAVRGCRLHLDARADTYDEWARLRLSLRPTLGPAEPAAAFHCPDELLRQSLPMHARVVRLDAFIECGGEGEPACRAYCEPLGLRLPVSIADLDARARETLASSCRTPANAACRGSIVGTFRKLPRSAQIEARSVLLPVGDPAAGARARPERPPVSIAASAPVPTGPGKAEASRPAPARAPESAADAHSRSDMVVCEERSWILPRTPAECRARGGRILD